MSERLGGHCQHCGTELGTLDRSLGGRMPRYCSPRCKQASYRARARSSSSTSSAGALGPRSTLRPSEVLPGLYVALEFCESEVSSWEFQAEVRRELLDSYGRDDALARAAAARALAVALTSKIQVLEAEHRSLRPS